jgi:hypothetical protein
MQRAATEASRAQHVVLRRLADELVAQLDDPAKLDGPAVHDTLSRIGSALKIHSEMEVEGMYSQLLTHSDAKIRELAAKMIGTIKDVYDGFATFQNAWTPERIRKKPETFVKQARFIVEALHESTKREEEGLYARVDAVFDALEGARSKAE